VLQSVVKTHIIDKTTRESSATLSNQTVSQLIAMAMAVSHNHTVFNHTSRWLCTDAAGARALWRSFPS
jgi:hypothetical protein